MKPRLLLLAVLVAGSAAAKAPAPPESPAVDTMKQDDAAGTTIMGERDSDLGLFLTPWKEEHADNIDPPPGLLDVPPRAIDPRRFARQVKDAAAINAYRREQLQPNR